VADGAGEPAGLGLDESDEALASPLTVAFVGQGVFFRHCALEQPAGGLEPFYVDFRHGEPAEPLLAKLQEIDPDVVLVFRPEIIPEGLFGSLRSVTIGYLTEPLPREGNETHEDLRARMWWLEQVDPRNFDRIISFDPLIADRAGGVVPIWRSLPLPVADSFFIEPHARASPPRLLFTGRSTEHRERLLAPVKEAHPLVHISHGLSGEPLLRLLRETDVELNLHNHPYPTFENRVSIALAAGHLVISEPLSPDHGLKAGTHYLEASAPAELRSMVDELARDPQAFADVQAAGRSEGERFRASKVYPELICSAVDDVATSGGRRR
jgi:hypothetical protein